MPENKDDYRALFELGQSHDRATDAPFPVRKPASTKTTAAALYVLSLPFLAWGAVLLTERVAAGVLVFGAGILTLAGIVWLSSYRS